MRAPHITYELVNDIVKQEIYMTEKKIEAVKEEKKRLNFKYLRDKDAQLVTGKFIFHEVPGGAMEFSYKAYKGEQVEKYNFKDNEVVSPVALFEKKLIPSANLPVKILGKEKLTVKVKFEKVKMSAGLNDQIK